MHVDNQRTSKKRQLRLVLPSGERRQASPTLKLLGVTLDSQWKFSKHVEAIAIKGKMVLGIIRRLGGITWGVTGASMRNLYQGCVRPILEYASPVWYPKITKQEREQLQRIQNTGLRAILGGYHQTPIDCLHRDTDIMPLEQRYDTLQDNYIVRLHRNVDPENPVNAESTWWRKHMEHNELVQRLYEVLPKEEIFQDRIRRRKPPWKKEDMESESKAWKVKSELKKKIYQRHHTIWETQYRTSAKGEFYRSYTLPRLYNADHKNPLRYFLNECSKNELSKLVQLRTAKGAFGMFFKRFKINNRPHQCECGEEEDVKHLLCECPVTENHRQILRDASATLDIKVLLDSKKGLKAVLAFLAKAPQLL
ncbi:reverse transcriptase [Sugiyamaella lignohabitans]|uniref:Reverse transcriptase n=1 Tax=Sugiyamaella lignohabitans TaxID=796027 RepID=A0A167EY09_9ASCO|nr:reverse transcriptase [Sugiyamaella lignohabitans]ANB14593.1 reverse transcriptase [Sugiyamaella lignohabitans]